MSQEIPQLEAITDGGAPMPAHISKIAVQRGEALALRAKNGEIGKNPPNLPSIKGGSLFNSRFQSYKSSGGEFIFEYS